MSGQSKKANRKSRLLAVESCVIRKANEYEKHGSMAHHVLLHNAEEYPRRKS